jgi:hypothetical protein
LEIKVESKKKNGYVGAETQRWIKTRAQLFLCSSSNIETPLLHNNIPHSNNQL